MSRNAGPSTGQKKRAISKRVGGKKGGGGSQGEDEGSTQGVGTDVGDDAPKAVRVKKEKDFVKNIVRADMICSRTALTCTQDDVAAQGQSTATAEATQLRRDTACARASLGWALIDVRAPYLKLSKWNDRPLDSKQVKKVVRNFFDDGPHFLRAANAIPVVIHRKEIDLTSLVGYDKIPDGVKPIVWLDRGEEVQIPNGRHRIESYKEYLKQRLATLDKAQKQLAMLVRKKAPEEELAPVRAVVEQHKVYTDDHGEWLAQFYDYGEYLI